MINVVLLNLDLWPSDDRGVDQIPRGRTMVRVERERDKSSQEGYYRIFGAEPLSNIASVARLLAVIFNACPFPARMLITA